MKTGRSRRLDFARLEKEVFIDDSDPVRQLSIAN